MQEVIQALTSETHNKVDIWCCQTHPEYKNYLYICVQCNVVKLSMIRTQ